MSREPAFTAHTSRFLGEDSPTKHFDFEVVDLPDSHLQDSVFTAPKDGIYQFSLSFVRDSQEDAHCKGSGVCTNEDVSMSLRAGPDPTKDGRIVGVALAGGGGSRATGTVSVAVKLELGEKVWVREFVDGKNMRRKLRECYFSGHYIRKD